MAVHSTQLGANGAIGTGGYTIYTCPAGKRTIVKTIVLQNTAAASNRVGINLSLVGGGSVLWHVTLGASASATESEVYDLWLVMNAGDSLRLTPAANSIEAVASGSELTV